MQPHLRYVTIRQFADLYPWPTQKGLRNIRALAPENGFGKAFITVGTRVLVDLEEFWKVIDSRKEK